MIPEHKEYLDREIKLNKLRPENFKQMLEILRNWVGFTNPDNQKEDCYLNLWQFVAFIEDFEQKTVTISGERKIAAETHLKSLYEFCNIYGRFYFESIIYRTKVTELEKERFLFLDKIKELEKELHKEKELNKF